MTAEPSFYACAIPFSRQRSQVRARIGRAAARRVAAMPGARRLSDERAEIFTFDEFLGPEQCAAIVALIDQDCRPSPLYNKEKFEGYRTSSTCNMAPTNPSVRQTNLALSGLLGIHPSRGESLQGQRYHAGQQFKAHADFFYIDQPYWRDVRTRGGQRTWTAMIYLDEPEGGGATFFPHLGIEVRPKLGRLLTWNNMAEDGSPNSWTIHEGQPVSGGCKHIVTKWYRERRWG